MTHSDDNGLVLPPNLAPIQVVIVPIYKGAEQLEEISVVANQIQTILRGSGVSVKFDDRDNIKPGFKFNDYELKGVPLRIAIGPKDLEKSSRISEKRYFRENLCPQTELVDIIQPFREDIKKFYKRHYLIERAYYRSRLLLKISKTVLTEKGGFISAHWDGTAKPEERLKSKLKQLFAVFLMMSKKSRKVCLFRKHLCPTSAFCQGLLKAVFY